MGAPDDNDDPGGVALVGGNALGALLLALGALLLWLLWRGQRWGQRERGAGVTAATAPPAPPPCDVLIRMAHIELDGEPADVPTIVARARASGVANVRAIDGASVQSIIDVIRALHAAGVIVVAASRLWSHLEGDRARATSRGGTHGE